MAVTLVPTPSATNANSWVDDDQFVLFIGELPNPSTAVSTADEDQRKNALGLAAQLIVALTSWDPSRISMNEDGRVRPAIEGQSLPIPAAIMKARTGESDLPTNVNPEFIKRAQMFQAVAILEGNRISDPASRGISEVTVDVITVKFDGVQSQVVNALGEQVKRELSFWTLGFQDGAPSSSGVQPFTPDWETYP